MSGAIPFYGAFESTYQPRHDRDVAETTGHTERWREDLLLLEACHVKRLRYPIRWHRVEPEPGRFDWRHTDEVLGHMQDRGLEPVVDLLHHTSYPRWLGDLLSPRFHDAFLRFCEAVAHRYPWLPGYTVCNEPFTTFLLCGQMGLWPPYRHGREGFVAVARNVFPAVTAASRALRDLLPGAEHVHVEVCERHLGVTPAGREYAELTNDRRFLLTDLLVGLPVDPDRPYVQALLAAGGEDLLTVEPGHVDVLGLDYYAHNQWEWEEPGKGVGGGLSPAPLRDVVGEYWDRYGLPCILGETNIRGYASDRATWLRYTLMECEAARDAGVDLRGYCWFPFIDSADWGSILAECVGSIDPVGAFWLDEHLDRRPSCMSVAYTMAASGVPAADLPAYLLRPPVSQWLAGWMPHMADWEWRLPPSGEPCSSRHREGDTIELRSLDVA